MAGYDISEDAWTELTPLPIEVNHPGVTALDGFLYLVGGNLANTEGTEEKSARLFRYDPARDRWRRLADAPSERAALGFAAIGRKLYAAGGYTVEDPTVDELSIYDVRRDRWRSGPEMPTGRNHVGAAALNGKLIVTGGRPGEINGGLATVESYDPVKRRWRELRPLVTARSGHGAVVARGRLIIFGGEELIAGGTTIEQVEAYDPDSRSWSALPEMVIPRHGLGAAALRGRIYALEGGPSPGLAYSNAVEFLDVKR